MKNISSGHSIRFDSLNRFHKVLFSQLFVHACPNSNENLMNYSTFHAGIWTAFWCYFRCLFHDWFGGNIASNVRCTQNNQNLIQKFNLFISFLLIGCSFICWLNQNVFCVYIHTFYTYIYMYCKHNKHNINFFYQFFQFKLLLPQIYSEPTQFREEFQFRKRFPNVELMKTKNFDKHLT